MDIEIHPPSFVLCFTIASVVLGAFALTAGQFEAVAPSILFIWLCMGAAKFLLKAVKRD